MLFILDVPLPDCLECTFPSSPGTDAKARAAQEFAAVVGLPTAPSESIQKEVEASDPHQDVPKHTAWVAAASGVVPRLHQGSHGHPQGSSKNHLQKVSYPNQVSKEAKNKQKGVGFITWPMQPECAPFLTCCGAQL